MPDRCTPSQKPAPHAFETSERGEAAPADSARHRVRPASPEQRVQDDGVDRGLINLFIQVDIERQFESLQKEWMRRRVHHSIQTTRTDQRHRLRMFPNVCPARQTAFPVRSSNVGESEGWQISVRAQPRETLNKAVLRGSKCSAIPVPAFGLSFFALPPDSAGRS